jgi:hypothetical protein
MLFFLEILLLFIKLFAAILIQLFLWDSIILKSILLVVCYVLLYSLLKRKYNPIKDNFPDKYKLITRVDHFCNILLLFIYSLVFTIGILFLRSQNMERSLDLMSYVKTLLLLISNVSFLSIILNILLIGFLLGLYWTIMRSLGRYYKYHIIKRHIYLSHGKSSTFYDHVYRYIQKISIYVLLRRVYRTVEILYRCLNFKELLIIIRSNNRFGLFKEYFFAYKTYNSFELFCVLTLKDLKFIIHHIICIIILIYDILFNNMVITHVFQILPYVFVYEIWIRITKFYSYIHLLNDMILYSLVYDPATMDRELGLIYTSSGELTMEDFQDIVFNYLFTGLISKDQQDRDKLTYLKTLKEVFLNKCSTIIIEIQVAQKRFIGLTMVDYIIIAQALLILTIVK